MFLNILLWLLCVLLALLFASKFPQGLVIPFSLVIWLLRAPLRHILRFLPRSIAYIGLGTFLGIVVEIFAIWQNLPLPDEKKVLFHPAPVPDLVLGFFFYLAISIAVYWFVRRYAFPAWTLLPITAVFSLLVEQNGAILLQVLANPSGGVAFVLVVTVVYVTFLFWPYYLLQDRFEQRLSPSWTQYLLLPFAMVTMKFLYGLTLFLVLYKLLS